MKNTKMQNTHNPKTMQLPTINNETVKDITNLFNSIDGVLKRIKKRR